MKSIDTKVLLFPLKLIGFLCMAFIVSVYMPQHIHHLLLIISAVLVFVGSRSLRKYKDQANWIEGKAKLKSINEREEEVAISEYSRLKYYYPEMEYEYVANGATHVGKIVFLEKENVWVPEVNTWGDPTPEERRWWLSLKPEDELPVYINPRNASEAVLMNDVAKERRSHHLALIVSGLLVGLIWLFLVSYNLTMPSSGR
jgi:hypothetical protein